IDAAPRDRLDDEALEAGGVEQAAVAEAAGSGRWRIAAEQDLGRAENVARLEADQLFDAQAAPGGDHLLGLRGRVFHRRGEECGIDRADRRAGDDVDRHVATHALGQIGAQVVNDSSLVRTTRPSARQDEADPWTSDRRLHANIVNATGAPS